MGKKEGQLATMGKEKVMLTYLSGLFDSLLWHEYLDEEYKTDKQMKKSRKKFISILEEAQAICNQLIAPIEARKTMKQIITGRR